MNTEINEILRQASAAKDASRVLARLSTTIKDKALLAIADSLKSRRQEILEANHEDHNQGKEEGLSAAVLDRLMLNSERLEDVAADVRKVAGLPDPIGESFDVRLLPNGLQVGRRRVPLGVIGAIFESRPNVTVDIASLCLKSGNAVMLRGGKETLRSNLVLADVLRDSISSVGMPKDSVQMVASPDRALVDELLNMRNLIDLMVPRGGAELIRHVAENAKMPVLTGGIGVCHTYVDKEADISKAVPVVDNAKTRKFSVCNALDTLLVHDSIAGEFLPAIAKRWAEAGVTMRCDEGALRILESQDIPSLNIVGAATEDFGTEFLSLDAAVKVVGSLEEALEHIHNYGTGHSDAIITEDYSASSRFVDEVDTAVVYVNASTQFTDGAQFGLGAEIIDSTQKTIARGPVGLREITTYKWTIFGSGQVRP